MAQAKKTDGHGDRHAHAHVVPVSTYLLVFATLMVLTYVTVWVSGHDYGKLNVAIALAIAIFKATLVVLFFMHVKYSPRLTQLVIGAAFLWLGILIIGTMHDYYAPDINLQNLPPTMARE